ncbi:g1280 [Coccomyxa elongata]
MWKDFGGSREAIDSDVEDTASREFAEETLGMFASQNVDSASVAASQVLMAAQLRDQRHSLEVVHKLKKGQYSMFIALLPFLDPLMFYLAMRQNAETQAVTGAEKTAFAWVRLDQLLAATARCASAYFLKSSLSVSGTVDGRRPVSHGGRRLMLHPCFASSLRLAQGAGVRKLVAAARKSMQTLQQPAPRLLHLAAQPRADQQQVFGGTATRSHTPGGARSSSPQESEDMADSHRGCAYAAPSGSGSTNHDRELLFDMSPEWRRALQSLASVPGLNVFACKSSSQQLKTREPKSNVEHLCN